MSNYSYNQQAIDFHAGEVKYQGNIKQFLKGLQAFDEDTLDPLIIKILTNIFGFKLDNVYTLLKDLGKSAIVLEATGIALSCDYAIDYLQDARDTLADSLLAADLFTYILAQISLFKNEIYNILGFSSFLICNQAIKKLEIFKQDPQIVRTQWIYDFYSEKKQIQQENKFENNQQRPDRQQRLDRQQWPWPSNFVRSRYSYGADSIDIRDPYYQDLSYNISIEEQQIQNNKKMIGQIFKDDKQRSQVTSQYNPYTYNSQLTIVKANKPPGSEPKELWYNPRGVTQRYTPFIPTRGITVLNK